MPDNYFRASDVPEIVEHLKLFRSFLENAARPAQDGFATANRGESPLAPAVAWKALPEQGHTVVSLYTWERERLLAKIAGSFSIVPINILSADLFPRADNAVLGVFRVCDTRAHAIADRRDFELVEQTLRRAMEAESFDFLQLIEKVNRQIGTHSGTGTDLRARI